MEGCLCETIHCLALLDDKNIRDLISVDCRQEKITKSLYNILYNVCVIKSLILDPPLKEAIKPFTDQVVKILDSDISLLRVKQIFLRNPELCRILAKACPRPTEL